MSTSIFGFSLPNFWIGLMLILFFAVYLGWSPAVDADHNECPWYGAVDLFGRRLAPSNPPALTLALYKASLVVRLCEAGTVRSSRRNTSFCPRQGLEQFRISRLHS